MYVCICFANFIQSDMPVADIVITEAEGRQKVFHSDSENPTLTTSYFLNSRYTRLPEGNQAFCQDGPCGYSRKWICILLWYL